MIVWRIYSLGFLLIDWFINLLAGLLNYWYIGVLVDSLASLGLSDG
jgi:hypothetical protein